MAVADGAGCPGSVLADLSAAARQVGKIDLLLGWLPAGEAGLDLDAFASVRRLGDDDGLAHLPALLAGPLRPDVLVASVCPGLPWFLTEVGWLRAAVDAGAVIAGVEREQVPVLDCGPVLPPERVQVIGADDEPASPVEWPAPTAADRAVAERVAGLVPTGARLRYGPGPMGTAVVDALVKKVRIDTSVVTDAVMDLDRRGRLLGRPLAPYVAGSAELYEWADGRADADRVERTHDPARLTADGPPLVVVISAEAIDHDGQVAGDPGAADHAAAAARTPGGLSVVAVRAPALVGRLPGPVSVPARDVDVVVTERGGADLRGLDRAGRRRAIEHLFK